MNIYLRRHDGPSYDQSLCNVRDFWVKTYHAVLTDVILCVFRQLKASQQCRDPRNFREKVMAALPNPLGALHALGLTDVPSEYVDYDIRMLQFLIWACSHSQESKMPLLAPDCRLTYKHWNPRPHPRRHLNTHWFLPSQYTWIYAQIIHHPTQLHSHSINSSDKIRNKSDSQRPRLSCTEGGSNA